MADAAAREEEPSTGGGGAKQTFKDLFAGAAGGVAQVLLGELHAFRFTISVMLL